MEKRFWKLMLTFILAMTFVLEGALAENSVEGPYPGLSWNSSLTDALMLPNEDAVVFNDTDADGIERDVVVSVDAPVGMYTADFTMLEFCEDELVSVYYKLNDDVTYAMFENLEAAICRRYGDPVCLDPALVDVDSFGMRFLKLKDTAEQFIFRYAYGFLNGYQGANNKNKAASYRAWEIGEDVLLVLGYYEAGAFFLKDYIEVALHRMQ